MRGLNHQNLLNLRSNVFNCRAKTVSFLRRFTRDEDGSLVIFAVYIFVMILMVGGIGIDLMRFERDRARLQYTLDRAVLAAADLDQTQDAQVVVEDYFSKAGLLQYLSGVTVSQGLGFRNVEASANADVETQFMHMTGLDTLVAPAASTAEESIGRVEVSLVLDVSGSMNSNYRLRNLKTAARDFIDQMVDNTEDGNLSISIIPYATQVSMPDTFFDHVNVSQEHDHSNCINFDSADFETTGFDDTVTLERTMHFDPWNGSDRRDNGTLVLDPVCEGDSRRESLLMEKDRNTLKDFITNLWADGNTSIDLGMKWGVAFLDPSMQTLTNTMVADGTVNADFLNRPARYNDTETLKVVVLMTDGQNTTQYMIRDQYRSGASRIWWNSAVEFYSVYFSQYNEYYWPRGTRYPIYANSNWQDHPFGNGTYRFCASYYNGYCYDWDSDEPEQGTAVQLDWSEVWAQTPARYARNYWGFDPDTSVGSTIKDERTRDICDAAKNEGIIVFTIGFEAPSSGEAVLQDCASSDAHFFDVDGLQISEAFSSIASSIRKLRLTQ